MTTKFLQNIDLNGKLTIAGSGGTSGYVLQTDGTGTVTWAASSGGLGYIGSTQTTASAGTTISLAVSSVATTPGGAISITGGTTSLSTGSPIGGSVTISGGAQSNASPTGTGGAVNINGGTSGANGQGGNVVVNGGVGGANGNGNVYIGNSTGTDVVYLGKSGASVSIPGNLSFDGASNLLTSTNAPGILSLSGLFLNFAAQGSLNTKGQFAYQSEVFQGWQTSTGSGRIPTLHSVFSLATSTASTNTTQSVFAAANDVLSSLEANKLYRFKATYYSSFTYTATSGAINIAFAFSNAPTAIKYSFKTYAQTASTAITYAGAYAVATASTIMPSQSSSGSWVTEIEGYFTTHATLASTFTPQFICTATASSSAVMTAGSFFEIEKLGTATTTLIAGNWA